MNKIFHNYKKMSNLFQVGPEFKFLAYSRVLNLWVCFPDYKIEKAIPSSLVLQ